MTIEAKQMKDIIFDRTVEQMKSLGTYKPEYNDIIYTYAELREQYIIITERFEKSRYRLQTKSAQGGMKKAPIVATLESLRKDILAYSDRLCLNPKAMDLSGTKPAPPKSKLDAALEAIGSG